MSLRKIVDLSYGNVTLSCPVENGHKMISIKRICELIDVKYENQDSWLKNHQYFAQLYLLEGVVAADGKQRKMNCMSIIDVMTWLAHIKDDKRKPGSLEKQWQLMAWLREQFIEGYKSVEKVAQERAYELEVLQKKEELEDRLLTIDREKKELKKELGEVNENLEKLRYDDVTGQLKLDVEQTL